MSISSYCQIIIFLLSPVYNVHKMHLDIYYRNLYDVRKTVLSCSTETGYRKLVIMFG